MDPLRLPSFFKVLLDPTRPYLPLPPDFVRKYLKNKIPENPTLQSVSGVGFSWRLKITKVDEMYSFTGGWKKVVQDTGLVFGDFLVFWLVDHSTFKVVIFGTNGCPKVSPPKVKLEHQEEEQQQEEDDDDDEEEEGEEDEDNDDDDDDDDDDEEEEEEEEKEEEEEEEKEEEAEDDGDVDRDEVNPFFKTTISKSHNYHLRFPSKFARLAGLEEERKIRMKNLDGKEWSIALQSETADYNRYYLSCGWSEFRKANRLAQGDECVFKFIRSQDKLCLAKHTKKVAPPAAVITKRPRGRPPHVEVVKRPRGRPPKKDNKLYGEVAAAVVTKRPVGRPPRVEVARKDSGAEVVVVIKRPVGRPVKNKERGPTV